MKKLGLNIGVVVLSACVLAGCVSYTRTAPDGTKVAVRGALMKVGNVSASTTDTNGVKYTIEVKELTGDTAMAAAVTEAAVSAMAKAAK